MATIEIEFFTPTLSTLTTRRTNAISNKMPLTSNDEASNKASIVAGKLKAIYKTNILPAEKRYQYDFFYESPFLTDTEFDAKPSVMLVGQRHIFVPELGL